MADARLEAIASELLHEVAGCVERGELDYRYRSGDGVLEVEVAPALTELAGPSEDDGATAFCSFAHVELSSIATLFEGAHVTCGEIPGEGFELAVEGKYRGVGARLTIRFAPFGDAEVMSVTRLGPRSG
jgi:hypothetical protein